jgi:MFS family permease
MIPDYGVLLSSGELMLLIYRELLDGLPGLSHYRTLVAILSFGALIPTMAANIFFPVINDLQADLNASQSSIALSISLYILAQGGFPLLWSPISEIVGRKVCFLTATTIFAVSMIVTAAAAQNVATLIALRVIGAGGSSAMLAIAAGTLADLYEPAERGVKVSRRVVVS